MRKDRIAKYRQLSLNELEQLYVKYLNLLALDPKSVQVYLNFTFYVWRINGGEFFWNTINDKFEKNIEDFTIAYKSKRDKEVPKSSLALFKTCIKCFKDFLDYEGNYENALVKKVEQKG